MKFGSKVYITNIFHSSVGSIMNKDISSGSIRKTKYPKMLAMAARKRIEMDLLDSTQEIKIARKIIQRRNNNRQSLRTNLMP